MPSAHDGAQTQERDLQKQRSTFLSIREVLERIRQHFGDSRRDAVREVRTTGASRRDELWLSRVERRAQEFDLALAQIIAEGRPALLETLTQYSSDPLGAPDPKAVVDGVGEEAPSPPATIRTIDDAVTLLQAFDARIGAICEQMATSVGSDDVTELLEAVARLVDSQRRAALQAYRELDDL